MKHDGYIYKIIEWYDTFLDPYLDPWFLFRKSKDQVFNHCTISEKRWTSTEPVKVCGDLANFSWTWGSFGSLERMHPESSLQ